MYIIGVVFVVSCSASIANGAPRIIGGHDATNHKYPYQVSLRRSGSHFCSGSILNSRWILTAAHCIKAAGSANYTISAGTNYLNESGDVYLPAYSAVHENYTDFHNYDIALIRTVAAIVFDNFVKPIKIPNVDVTNYENWAVFSGWGVTNLSLYAIPNNLQEIDLKLASIEKCRSSLGSVIIDRHICTYTKAQEGICYGDSGGPLVFNGSQVGIASFVMPCAVGHPDVYTRVYSYKKWIESKIEQIF